MASWREVTESAPEFAGKVRELMDAHKHKTIATLRRDGSPRISGIEADFVGDELWFGSMPGALKALDLRRDPRFALHSASVAPPDDPSAWPGDAKFSGHAIEVTDRAELEAMFQARGLDAAQFADSHFFRADIHEVVLTRVAGDHLDIDLWRADQGLRRFERK
ncbi:Pyridoxamine 5'-phosphate oxidase [Thermomonospora echinospora]|uniref:Pyridoxamine 5'-phosphate oxidase n=1 Tax=Thermomonospora echinospora TaxID=1992 RepID=A0A1H6E666_9ACTN|nr:pyridoxamine 5'-phosphate oxidase family protein [Thermomonospora echinospora]SEG92375.1 Pyridoxamine 5'-phosphate oxidase [Thermomonospora echinospora]